MSRAPSEPPILKGFTYSRLLGSGGFADVFLYDQELPKRQVAVKVMLTEGLTAASRAAFVAEANVMAQLAHPYIVKIHHADVSDDGRPYLIMEYCSGRNLADQYKQHPLDVAEALRTGVRLSSAIATAHAAGILHRDIKPANVLTNNYGWPALTDFGISSALEDELPTVAAGVAGGSDTGSSTQSESVGLSIPWSPPEMFDDDPKPDVRSDVFSLSATIYTLLAGRTPFEVAGRQNQTLDLINRIERGTITPMDRQDVPPSLLAVLRKGMAVDRAQRFASAVDFARALQRVEIELSYSPTQIDVPNLVVPKPEARVDDDHADATRARGVTSIAAQPPVAPTIVPPAFTPAPVAAPQVYVPASEATVIRDRGVEEKVPTGVPAPESVAAAAPRRRTGLVVGVSIGVVVAVVGGVVALNALAGGEAGTDRPPAVAESDDGPIVSAAVPTPTLVSAAPDATGSAITFTWENPEVQDGDSYVWQRTDGAGDPQRVPTQNTTATITEVTAGTTVCIDVFVRRGGELSPEPLAACYP